MQYLLHHEKYVLHNNITAMSFFLITYARIKYDCTSFCWMMSWNQTYSI